MGNDKTPLTNPQNFEFKGIFEPNSIFDGIKDFLEKGKGYDVSEKAIKEKNLDDAREFLYEFGAEIDATDHIRYDIQIELKMKGKNVTVEDNNGTEHLFIDGEVGFKIYSFIVINDNKHRANNFFVEFFSKIYTKYFNSSEMSILKKKAEKDVAETITRFKQLSNMSAQK